jgi:histidinol-phosphate aminotransferase
VNQTAKNPPVAPTASDNVKASSPAGFPPNVSTGRLNLNEPAFAPSPKVIEAIRVNAEAVARYPDAKWVDLAQALSTKLSVQPDQLMFGNGSDELLSFVGHAFLQQDSAIVYPAPSFPRYRMMAEFAGAQSLAVPVRANGSCDVDAMLGVLDAYTRIIVVTTPNNPTGAMLSAEELEKFAQTLVVVDEAYFEFAQHAGGADAIEVMRKRNGPWIVLRTFSKAYALAGLRLGYGIASSPDVIEALNRVRTPFNVNTLAQIAALAALQDEPYMNACIEQCATARDKLVTDLTEAGMPCLPTVANFIAVNVGTPAADFVSAMAAKQIYINALGPTHPTHIRVTVGSTQENQKFLETAIQIKRDG